MRAHCMDFKKPLTTQADCAEELRFREHPKAVKGSASKRAMRTSLLVRGRTDKQQPICSGHAPTPTLIWILSATEPMLLC